MSVNRASQAPAHAPIGVVEFTAEEPRLGGTLGSDVAWHSNSKGLASALIESPVNTVVFHIRIPGTRMLLDTVGHVKELKPDATMLLAASSPRNLLIAEIKSLVSTDSVNHGTLSERESQVLTAIRAGQTNREIASSLGISLSTVNRHVEHILQKKAARNRAQAAAE